MAEIRIEVVYEANGGEELGLYAEGHHVPADFVAAVEAWRLTPEGAWLPSELVPTVLLSEVRHETWRNEDDGDGYVFRPASPGEPGAYPVTCFAFEGGTLAAPPAPAPSPPETPATDWWERGFRAGIDAASREIAPGPYPSCCEAHECETKQAWHRRKNLQIRVEALRTPPASPASAPSRGTDHDPATKEQS